VRNSGLWIGAGLVVAAVITAGCISGEKAARELSQPPQMEANEAAAVRSLRTINVACVAYVSAYQTGYPRSLSNLGKSGPPSATSADMIDNALAGATKDGYSFTYRAGAANNGVTPSYIVQANPAKAGKTGRRYFFTDQTGVIRYSDSQAAMKDDPPISSAPPPSRGKATPEQVPAQLAYNEASALGSVRTLNTACVTYAVSYNTGYPRSLGNLGGSGSPSAASAAMIDNALAGGTKDGYEFKYRPGAANGSMTPTYTIQANPITPGETGQRYFFTDETGIIRYNLARPATKDDPPIN
jgi:type IV pilus assembly protein PilA